MGWSWRHATVLTHRWLGIAIGWIFVIWFASGIVMMYARMPELPAEEARRRLPPLDLSSATATLATLTPDLGLPIERVRISMLDDRPVYRISSGRRTWTFFADGGEALEPVAPDAAMRLVRIFAPEHASTLHYEAHLADVDQWTFGVRAAAPFHRVALGDPQQSRVYVSEATGEIVMRTTASERRAAYLGAVLHWLYFTPLRRNAPLWTQTIIWLSIAGCLLCIAGLAWGVLRARPSPYTGLMKWHHYSGLVFGVTTLTFVFSGLLSMTPWGWSPGTTPTRAQRERVAGGALKLEDATPDRLRSALASLNDAPAARACGELELHQAGGALYARCDGKIVALDGRTTPRERLPQPQTEALAWNAVPDARPVAAEWLVAYDAYYYSRRGERPLPVLRVKYDDANRTWLYFDPRTGSIARKEERRTRVERWLYHGLHSLDFPLLYNRRPLWDAVVIALSLGGLALSATTLLPGWRRVKRRLTWRS